MASSTFKVGERVRVLAITHRADLDCYLPAYGVVMGSDVLVGRLRVRVPAILEDPQRGWYVNIRDLRKVNGLFDI